MMSPTLYQKLPEGRFTRLLKSASRTAEEPFSLQLELRAFDLENSCPEYAALSYTWGPPFTGSGSAAYEGEASKLEVDLRVDEGPYQKVNLDRNLYEGILRIFRGRWDSWLWVDAVCINQDDLDEKTKQVNQMSVVYRNATIVLCWLGEPDEHTGLMYDFYDGYGATCERLVKETGKVSLLEIEDGDDEFKVVCTATRHEITLEMLQTVIAFYRRRYFSRVWVIQEFCLPPKSEFLFGSRIFTYRRLLNVVTWLISNYQTLGMLWEDGFCGLTLGDGNIMGLVHRSYEFFNQIEVLKSTERKGGPLAEGFDEFARKERQSGSTRTSMFVYLEELIWRTRGFEATVGHDNVCALLGLVNPYVDPSTPPLIIPDYALSVSAFYRYVASVLLKEVPSLTTLGLLRPDNRDKSLSLPTWCPNFVADLRARGKYGVQAAEEDSDVFVRYDAYPTRNEQNSGIQIDEDRLELFAAYFDRVTSFADPGPDMHSIYGLWLKSIRSCLFILRAIDTLGPSYHNGERIETAVLKSATYIFHERENDILSQIVDAFKYWVASTVVSSEEEIQKGAEDDDKDLFHELQASRRQCLEILQRLAGSRGLPTHAEVETVTKFIEDINPDSTFEEMNSMYGERFDSAFFGALNVINALIQTSKGYIGMTARSVRENDEVWIPCRGRVPLVLRPVEGKAGFYTVVGETYIHGVMRGELVEQGLLPEPRKITLI